MCADLPPVEPSALTGRDFALTHVSDKGDPLHRPVRGDLAHIRCAGRIFVPHYAVPMPHRVTADATPLIRSVRGEPVVLGTFAVETLFNVLDLAGDWAWGQIGEDGLVGYIRTTELAIA